MQFVGHVSYDRAREVVCSAYQMLYPEICYRDAWQSPDRDRQHSPRRGEATHNFWCPAKRCLVPPNNIPAITRRYKPRSLATHHGRDARRICCREHPACRCNILHCTCAIWISTRQCQPCRQYRPWTPHEGQLLRTSLFSVCCMNCLIFEGFVDAILRGRVLTEMSCPVDSGEGIITCPVVRCDSAVFFFATNLERKFLFPSNWRRWCQFFCKPHGSRNLRWSS